MKKTLEEVGKGIIGFANLLAVLFFFRAFLDYNSWLFLIAGVIAWSCFYVLGALLLKKSEQEEKR